MFIEHSFGSLKVFGYAPTMSMDVPKKVAKLFRDKHLAESRGRSKEVADYCNVLGTELLELGRLDEALDEHQQEANICLSINDELGAAVARRRIGDVLCERAQPGEALREYIRYLETAKRLNKAVDIQRATASIGRTYLLMAEALSANELTEKSDMLTKAGKWFTKSLKLVASLSEVTVRERAEMEARLLLNLGIVADADGNAHLARNSYKKAICITTEHQLPEDARRLHESLALSYQQSGEYTEALSHLQQALQLCRQLQAPAALADALSARAMVQLLMGDVDGAKRSWYRAYKQNNISQADRDKFAGNLKYAVRISRAEDELLLAARDELRERMRLHETLGDSYSQLSANALALEHYTAQLQCVEALGLEGASLASVCASLAETCRDMQKPVDSRHWYLRELETLKGNSKETCKTLLNLAVAEAAMGAGVDAVCELYRRAVAEASDAGLHALRAVALRDMADSLTESGLHQQADGVRVELAAVIEDNGLASDYDDHIDTPQEDSIGISSHADLGDIDVDRLSGLSGDDDDEDVGTSAATTAAAATGSSTRRHRGALTFSNKLWRNNKGETHLHVACIHGRTKQVAKLLEAGHPVNVRDHSGWLPIHEAANFGHLAALRLLLAAGAAVDDAGGEHCAGTTPLHDAAANGHVESVRVLLQAGASPTVKNNQGMTPVEYLRAYQAKYVADGGCEASHISDITQLGADMERVFQQTGMQIPVAVELRSDNPDGGGSSGVDYTDLSYSNSDQMAGSPHVDDGGGEGRIARVRVDEDELTDDPTELYRNAIKRVGKSALRSRPTAAAPRLGGSTQRSALVGEQQYEWLENDMGSTCRRRRPSPVFNTLSTDGDSAPRRRSSPLPFATSSSDNPPPASTVETGTSQKSAPAADDEITIDECSDSEIPSTASDAVVSRRTGRKRHRQTRISPPAMQRSHNASVADPDVADVNQQDGDLYDSQTTSYPVLTTNQRLTSASDVGQGLRVLVEVAADRLLIPVPDSVSVEQDVGHIAAAGTAPTIAWLVQQTSDRYHRQFLLRPHVELLRNGAILSPADRICDIISGQDDIIQSKVLRWDNPPLSERYATACQLLQLPESAEVSSRLTRCQQRGPLDLSCLGLRDKHVQPVLQAIQRYACVTQLQLKCCVLRDTGVKVLAEALVHLGSVQLLDISCVRMTSTGLAALSAAVGAGGALQRCTDLLLAYNMLFDPDAGHQLAALVSGLPRLDLLDLTSCHLQTRHVTQHRQVLTDALKASRLGRLLLSFNQLGSIGVDLLLRCLNADWPLQLELRGCCGDGGGLLGAHLMAYSSRASDCSLQQLDIADCQLVETDVLRLTRALPRLPHLVELDISGNVQLCACASVCQLIMAASACGSSLFRLRAASCSCPGGGPRDEQLAQLLADDGVRLEELVLGRISQRVQHDEALGCSVQAWRKRWGARANVYMDLEDNLHLCLHELSASPPQLPNPAEDALDLHEVQLAAELLDFPE